MTRPNTFLPGNPGSDQETKNRGDGYNGSIRHGTPRDRVAKLRFFVFFFLKKKDWIFLSGGHFAFPGAWHGDAARL